MKKKITIILTSIFLLIITFAIIGFVALKQDGIKINQKNFPEETVRKIAIKADKNKNSILSEKEAESVKEIYLKKFYPQDVIDIFEYKDLPSYTDADFTFDFKGIEHFKNATKLTLNLADGEYFNKKSNKEQIYVKTTNLDYIYKLKNLKNISMYEVEFENIDIEKLKNLEKINLNNMYNMKSIKFQPHSKLKTVWLSGNDKLTDIDLSNLINLKSAHIRYNNNISSVKFGENNAVLKTLSLCELPKLNCVDLSLCKGLEDLTLEEIPIDQLNLFDNTDLKYITLSTLKLKTLDLRQNPKLSEIVTEYNSVEKMLISDNNKISWVRWINSDITEFPLNNLNGETLVGLDIQNTKISKLDISRYYNLESVYYDKQTTTIIGDINNIS